MVNIGLGFQLEMSWSEALGFIPGMVSNLQKQHDGLLNSEACCLQTLNAVISGIQQLRAIHENQ